MTVPSNVLPSVSAITEDDARELLSQTLRALCSENGPTRVARTLGCDERTVRNARDETSTLRLDLVSNLLLLSGAALDPILARFNRRSVPIDATCSTDALPAMTGAVHKLVVATSASSPDGSAVSRSELMESEDELRAAFDAIGALLGRIDKIKRGEAA